MNRQGFSLVELAVVLALIGITATVAAVSLRPGHAELRSKVSEVRFGLEKAKQETLARGRNVYVEFFDSAQAFDCNRDGQVNPKDLCYSDRVTCCVLYADRFYGEEHTSGLDPENHDIVECLEIPSSLTASVAEPGVLRFSPFGGSREGEIEMSDGVRTYRLVVNHIGGIQVQAPEEN